MRANSNPPSSAQRQKSVSYQSSVGLCRDRIDQRRMTSTATRLESRGSLALGMLLFVLLGAAVIVINTPVSAGMSPLLDYLGIGLWFGSYLLALGLALRGWLTGFPRWVYPYLVYVVVFPLYLAQTLTPGLEFFGGSLCGHQLWGWRAFVPLGLAVLLAVSLRRPPWSNLMRLFANVWDDWTLAVFALFGLLPLVACVSLHAVDRAFAFWPKLAGVGLIGLGALLYLRLARPRQGCLALLTCAALAVAVMSGSAGYYWNTHYVNLITGLRRDLNTPAEWLVVLRSAAMPAVAVTGFLLLPLPLLLARRCLWLRSRRPSRL